jgi:hypothetical protein
MNLFSVEKPQGEITLYNGSSLEVLPELPDNAYDAIITSPPYCNRYDYTRTYALELALLGIDEQGLVKLRQDMLSCTVENRAKDLLKINSGWTTAIAAADEQELLQVILKYLHEQKSVCRKTWLLCGEYSCIAEWQRQQQPANGRAWARSLAEVCLCVEKVVSHTSTRPYQSHLQSSNDLVTT